MHKLAFGLVKTLILILLAALNALAHAEEEKMYRTDLESNKGWFAVSPDGRQLVFTTNKLSHGLRLIDLKTGNIKTLPVDNGRNFGFPSWSPDGKWIVLVSAEVIDGHYSLNNMEIVLLEVGSWQRRTIAAGDGVKNSPFFSVDGNAVLYFKGQKRESGKTPAARYELYSIDLASGREIQLTNEEFYQASKGNDDGRTVLLSATPNFNKRQKDALGVESRNALFLYDKANGSISNISVDQSSGIFDFTKPKRDKAGNLYFVSAKAPPGGGNYIWFLMRATSEGKQPIVLTSMQISMSFDIARNTGEIFVMDRAGEELIFRRLTIQAAH